ncbi:hypothetical protein K3495_g16963, partial [Podosphaera aphanis]
MVKFDENPTDWGLNLVTNEQDNISINAIMPLEFKLDMADALKLDKHASQLLQHQLPDNWHLEDGALWYNLNRLYIPEALRIKAKELSHDSPLAGHWGIARTTDLAQRNYYWPGMTQDIHNYVAGCQLCARNKSKTHKKHGKLSPLPIPE